MQKAQQHSIRFCKEGGSSQTQDEDGWTQT